MKTLTEEETKEPNASFSESDEIMHHIEEIKNIKENRTITQRNGKKNEIQKEFRIDTGSPVTIMPFDEPKFNSKPNRNTKKRNRYHYDNKKVVKFQEKVAVNNGV